MFNICWIIPMSLLQYSSNCSSVYQLQPCFLELVSLDLDIFLPPVSRDGSWKKSLCRTDNNSQEKISSQLLLRICLNVSKVFLTDQMIYLHHTMGVTIASWDHWQFRQMISQANMRKLVNKLKKGCPELAKKDPAPTIAPQHSTNTNYQQQHQQNQKGRNCYILTTKGHVN